LHLDYTAPFDEIRKEFYRLIGDTDLWDKRVAGMQVTNTTEITVEVRLLVSAVNSGKLFDLRCYIRENIIAFIQKNYPESPPKTRTVMMGENNEFNSVANKLNDDRPTKNELRTTDAGEPIMNKKI